MLRGSIGLKNFCALAKSAFVGAAGGAMLIASLGCTNSNSLTRASLNSPTVVSVETRNIASPGPAAIKMADLKNARAARSVDERLQAAFATTASPIVASKVTFDKAAILNREFLYGSDLQYSSIGEDDGMLLQSLSIGHVTARFQVLGDRLQLMAEEKYRFESDINIPLRLLHEWSIINETPNTITIDIVTASPTLASLFGAENPARSSWVRSVEFVPQGSYLLVESSVELADGKVAEFMESLFPRDTLVTGAPGPIFDDASIEPMADRFGFLSNTIWSSINGTRTKTAVAQRFSPPAVGKTIDWYVTPNIPAEYIPAVKAGVEGWNRYSQKMWNRDFISFKGVLPTGVKIGDPRYNVINWDSVADASSAYESQSSDQMTGIQSHSLIYLPYAWVKIGREFWERGELTQNRTATLKAALDQVQFLGKKVDVRCFNDGALVSVDPKMKMDPDTFSKELLRGTLFHEVGHALGLAHNFKGSTSWDPDVPGSLFTYSIMDYNHYEAEGGAFDGPASATGPLLEYDRQILSVLYNEAKDIAATDAELPHCDDSVADSKAGGVDPFCIRYDAGKDPSVFLQRTMSLIQDPNASLGTTKSLAAAAAKSIVYLGDASAVTSELELRVTMAMFRAQMAALIQYYVSAGAQGLNFTMSSSLRDLATFKAGSVPTGFDPVAMRARIAATMDEVMTLERFSPATQTAFGKIGDDMAIWLKSTPWYGTAAQSARVESELAMKTLASDTLELIAKNIVPRVRARQIQALARSATAPFFLTTSVDYEAKALSWLELILVKTLPSGASYSLAERVAAAQTLATFKGIPQAANLKATARTRVESEIPAATSAEEREALRALLTLLQ
jgi:hypothetical protein